jgi:hypothetical protein
MYDATLFDIPNTSVSSSCPNCISTLLYLNSEFWKITPSHWLKEPHINLMQHFCTPLIIYFFALSHPQCISNPLIQRIHLFPAVLHMLASLLLIHPYPICPSPSLSPSFPSPPRFLSSSLHPIPASARTTATTELGLVPLKVLLVLEDLDERLCGEGGREGGGRGW